MLNKIRNNFAHKICNLIVKYIATDSYENEIAAICAAGIVAVTDPKLYKLLYNNPEFSKIYKQLHL